MWLLRFFAAPENFAALRRGGYYLQIPGVVGGSVIVRHFSTGIASFVFLLFFCETECNLCFHLPLEAIY